MVQSLASCRREKGDYLMPTTDKVTLYQVGGRVIERYFDDQAARDDFEARIADDPRWAGFRRIGRLSDDDWEEWDDDNDDDYCDYYPEPDF